MATRSSQREKQEDCQFLQRMRGAAEQVHIQLHVPCSVHGNIGSPADVEVLPGHAIITTNHMVKTITTDGVCDRFGVRHSRRSSEWRDLPRQLVPYRLGGQSRQVGPVKPGSHTQVPFDEQLPCKAQSGPQSNKRTKNESQMEIHGPGNR
jgi:hypothetical protein